MQYLVEVDRTDTYQVEVEAESAEEAIEEAESRVAMRYSPGLRFMSSYVKATDALEVVKFGAPLPVCRHGVKPVIEEEPPVMLEFASGAPMRYLPGRKSLRYDCPTPHECQVEGHRQMELLP